MRVLLIEDDPLFVRLMRELISELPEVPFDLVHAGTLAEGIRILDDERIDVLLLDLMLPDSMRLDTLLQVVDHAPHLPVVVLTTLADEATGVAAVQAGAQDYLFKGDVTPRLISRAVRYAKERKQAEEATKQANRNLNLMNNITRHDIANQLAVVLGYVPLCQELANDASEKEYLARVMRAAESIRGHIDFSRDYQNIGAQSPRWQDVGSAVDRAVSSLDLGTVNLTVDVKEIEVFADPMLAKVFYNLIDNALRHGGNVTKISIRSDTYNGNLLVLFEDNGIGIPNTEKERVFSRGVGVDHGYGLYLIRGILSITMMEIRETGIFGEGARFEIRVPPGYYRCGSPAKGAPALERLAGTARPQ
jgi:signal transduction histidine kinase